MGIYIIDILLCWSTRGDLHMVDRINRNMPSDISVIMKGISSVSEKNSAKHDKTKNIGDVITNFGNLVNKWEKTFVDSHVNSDEKYDVKT